MDKPKLSSTTGGFLGVSDQELSAGEAGELGGEGRGKSRGEGELSM